MTEYGYSPDFLVGPPQCCPWCGHILNAIGQAQSATCEVPESGDRTVCMACAEVSIFGDGGALRRATAGEIDDEVRVVQADIRRLQKELGRE